jgi:hypothetical protein
MPSLPPQDLRATVAPQRDGKGLFHEVEACRLTSTSSRQVAWLEVYLFVAPLLAEVAPRPVAGTPDWCALPDDDPRKLAAVIEAGVQQALRIDTEQATKAQAAQDISLAEDWRQLAQDVRNHESIRIRRRAS